MRNNGINAFKTVVNQLAVFLNLQVAFSIFLMHGAIICRRQLKSNVAPNPQHFIELYMVQCKHL